MLSSTPLRLAETGREHKGSENLLLDTFGERRVYRATRSTLGQMDTPLAALSACWAFPSFHGTLIYPRLMELLCQSNSCNKHCESAIVSSMIDPVAIPEAANILGLSSARARALAARGQLPAAKVGGRWLVERAAVEARRRRNSPDGRPFAPHNAWALLLLASGADVAAIDSSVRSRLRRALSLEGLERLGPRLARRAEVRFFNAHPGEIPYLLEDPELVRSGVSAAGAHGLDLVSGQEADGYLHAGALEKFAATHALSPAGPEGNVRLRLVSSEAWRFLAGAPLAPLAAVALDLAEDTDPRSARAGRAALHDLDRHRDSKRVGRRPIRA